MKILFLCSILFTTQLHAQLLEVKRDNGTYQGNALTKLKRDVTGWEESVILQPKGPAQVDEIYLYLDGSAGTMELWIVGDPAEGGIPGTGWVRSFNKLTDPIVIEYSGTPGWDTIDVRGRGIHSDGYDRICIQHTVQSEEGPFFGIDRASSSSGSFHMNPDTTWSGIPGGYRIAPGNFMVRIGVRYDFPNATGSQNPPASTFVYKSIAAGLTGSDNKALKSARVSVADWNGDGYDDVVIGGQFFVNDKDSTFTNVTSTIGLTAGSGITFGDFNNDGHIDAYGANGGAADKIYKNNGDGTFSDVTSATGITNENPTVTPIWFDYDRDGWLDLYIANGRTEVSPGVEQFFPDQLWHNKGDGTFENTTAVADLETAEPDPYFDCWGASPCDYDADGWTDIFVATYRLAPDMLLRNNHNGTFSDQGEATGVRGVETVDPAYFAHGIGCDWGDFNNDGLPDLCVGNLSHPDWRGQYANPSLIFRNNGPGQAFTEMHMPMGLKFFEMNAGTLWLDLDLDGHLDLWHSQYSYSPTSQDVYRRSRMYLNEGPDKNFHLDDVTWDLGCNVHGAWTAVRSDLDQDGDPDLIAASPTDVVKYFRNDIAKDGRWLAIRLKGDAAKKVNMDAYGTSVKVYAGGKLIYRDLMGGGYGTTASQNSNELLFGLGYVSQIDSAVFTWPDGYRWTTNALKPNSRYSITYPDKILTVLESVRPNEIPNANLSAQFSDGIVHLRLSLMNTLHHAIIEVSDILGNTVLSAVYPELASSEITLDGNSLASGSYLLKITTSEGYLTTKFQVVR